MHSAMSRCVAKWGYPFSKVYNNAMNARENQRDESALPAGSTGLDGGAQSRKALVWTLASALGERNNLGAVRSVVRELGAERAQELARAALRIEAAGGMLTTSGKRRTPGGIFFQLAREAGWPGYTPSGPPGPRMGLAAVSKRFEKLTETKGKIDAMIVQFIGRPRRALTSGGAVLLIFESRAEQDSVPRGLPLPPTKPFEVRVMMSRREWTRVADEVRKNRHARLAIKGQAVDIPELGGLVIWADQVSVKKPKEQPV